MKPNPNFLVGFANGSEKFRKQCQKTLNAMNECRKPPALMDKHLVVLIDELTKLSNVSDAWAKHLSQELEKLGE
ncbi:MAG: hypothetical protein MJE68_03125 [Proteobacteria bacterium]|nr:hypothetical protein [Pseudomonadota bacterium]